MRRLTDRVRLDQFMHALAQATREPTTVYFTGGATALLHGFRAATIDIDIKIVPNRGDLLREISRLKEELEVNVELASPDLFLPVSSGWNRRSPLIERIGTVTYRHFDLVAQALGKIERGHERDLRDVADLVARGLVAPEEIRAELDEVESELYRYPAVDPVSLRASVERVLGELEGT